MEVDSAHNSSRSSKESQSTLVFASGRPSNGLLDDSFWSKQSHNVQQWTLPASGDATVTNWGPPPSSDLESVTGSTSLPRRPSSFVLDGPGLQILVGSGSGQFHSPFALSRGDMADVLAAWGFSKRFLRRLNGRISMFESLFTTRRRSHTEKGTHQDSRRRQQPDTLEIAMSTFETNGFHCFGILDLARAQGQFCIFVKESTSISQEWALKWLDESAALLRRHPLLVPNVVLAGVQKHVHNFVAWRVAVNEMEAQIGVTADKRGLQKRGYSEETEDLDQVNNHLSTLKKAVADQELTVGTVLEHAKAYLRVVQLCETLAASKRHIPDDDDTDSSDDEFSSPHSTALISEPLEELRGSVVRADIYLRYLRTMDTLLQNHTTALYNRISRYESALNLAATQSMKTIAVVTLAALPPTFIATLFSTSIFDALPARTQWRVLVFACFAVWGVTFGVWVVWFRWGSGWVQRIWSVASRTEGAVRERFTAKGRGAGSA